MSATMSVPVHGQPAAGLIAGEFFYSTTETPDAEVRRVLYPLDLLPIAAEAQKSIRQRVAKILSTRANGVPKQYENAWAWAADWIRQHGVTLPPDTTEYRSLRNWFCYQVNMHKKGKLSARSKQLLAQYGIDLSLYRAPNTGRGELLDDKRMILLMQAHYAITGSYDLPADADAQLLEWQRRLLQAYLGRGTSARMKAIESQLAGFEYGLWMRPNETPIPASQMGWWHRAREFKHASREFPAFRGRIDPRIPQYLAMWASQQLTDLADGRLTKRQRGELISLNLIAGTDHVRSRERAQVLKQARALLRVASEDAPASQRKPGNHERNLKMFLGAALLARLLHRNAPLTEIYSELSITPIQFERVRQALDLVMAPLVSLSRLSKLRALRECYSSNPGAFDAAHNVESLPDDTFASLGKRQRIDVERLAGLILEVRDRMRDINVRQDLPKDADEQALTAAWH